MRIGAYWSETYKKTKGMPYPAGARGQWVQLERWARTYGQERTRWCIWKFLGPSYEEDDWCRTMGWGIQAFGARLNGLLLAAHEQKLKRDRSANRSSLDAISRDPRVGVLIDDFGASKRNPAGRVDTLTLPLFGDGE